MITVKVDWLSMSAIVPLGLTATELSLSAGLALMQHCFGGDALPPSGMRVTRGRGAAHWGLYWKKQGVALYAGDESGWIAVEFSGLGCDWLRSRDALDVTMQQDGYRVTRIDIAIDMRGDIMPGDIDKTIAPSRFKSNSHVESASGESYYYGSPKSARMLRVYRYAKPHPRSDRTRLEFVCRDSAARNLAGALRSSSVGSCAAELVRKFGVTSPTLSGLGDATKLSGYDENERQKPGRFRWITDQAIPGIAKAILDGITTEDEVIAGLRLLINRGRVGDIDV